LAVLGRSSLKPMYWQDLKVYSSKYSEVPKALVTPHHKRWRQQAASLITTAHRNIIQSYSKWIQGAAMVGNAAMTPKICCGNVIDGRPRWSSGCVLNSGLKVEGSIPTREGEGFLRAIEILHSVGK
jgi:hypothetical protein